MVPVQKPEPAIKVAVIEDDVAVRRSLVSILAMDPGILCTGSFESAEAALAVLPGGYPDVLLIDINLPGMDGVEFVRCVAETSPGTKLIMLTVHNDTEAIFQSLAAGASGYLLKPARAAELTAAVKDVQNGGAPMTGEIARKVVQSFRRPVKNIPVEAGEELSPREVEVLDLLAKGYLYKEVADRLNVGYATVHTHVARIYQKLHVRSRAQAVAKYRNL